MIRLIALLALSFWLSPAAASTVVGTGSIKDRAVEILANGTWRFKTSDKIKCTDIKLEFTFCAPLSVWAPAEALSNSAIAAFKNPDGLRAQVLFYQAGRLDGLTDDDMNSIILKSLMRDDGYKPDIVKVYVLPTRYDVTLTKVISTFHNKDQWVVASTPVIRDHQAFIFQTWQNHTTVFSRQQEKLHKSFVLSMEKK